MVSLYFLQYNNYFNQRVKKPPLLSDDVTWFQKYQIGNVVNVSLFNYGDGVDTTQIINTTNWSNEYEVPDYMVLINNEDGNQQYWYVIEWQYLRRGQFQASLRRDLLRENYFQLRNSTDMLIRKGFVNENDSAIFNSEGQIYNQIKSDEILLYDETKCPWVVGYVPADSFKDANMTVEGQTYDGVTDTYNNLEAFEEDYPYNKDMGGTRVTVRDYREDPILIVRANKYVAQGSTAKYAVNLSFNKYGPKAKHPLNILDPDIKWITTSQAGYYEANATIQNRNVGTLKYILPSMSNLWNNVNAEDGNSWDDINNSVLTAYPQINTDIEKIEWLSNKIFKIAGVLYRVNVLKTFTQFEAVAPASTIELMKNKFSDIFFGGAENAGNYLINLFYIDYSYELVQIPATIKTTMLTASERPRLVEQPYGMFVMPYGELNIYNDSDQIILTTNKNASISIAQGIATSLGKDLIYDVQLLPYCPLRNAIEEDGKFRPGNIKFQSVTDSEGNELTRLYWCTENRFSFNINLKLSVENYKVENETTNYRLCSPNYNGLFDFNLAKNGGLDYIEVDCTYMPYNPYIKLNPNFKRLYGKDFNDQRGLICGGDFSLPQVSSAWADYQLNNKNYQKIFDREVQSIELNNALTVAGEFVGSSSSLFPSFSKNTSSYRYALDEANNALARLAGTTAGGVGSLITTGSSFSLSGLGGALGTPLNIATRIDQLNLKKDLFNYNLQNVQALPQSISKTNAFNINSKYVPFLEKYSCTEEEKNNLINKLKWQGMTIMRVGKISEFINSNENETYVEAMPLRLELNNLGTHELNVISEELNKGNFWEN